MSTPVAMVPARYAPSAPTPRPKPTAMGANTARMPGVMSSRSESRVTMSTTLPYSGFSVPSMMPGCSRNWRRTSKMTAPAARETALMARPENRNTTAAPMIMPTRLAGLATLSTPRYWILSPSESNAPPRSSCAFAAAPNTASRKDPNRAVAARTAVAMAMPLVMALVELPTASRRVSTLAPSPCTSPDISAMPCALSETGPKVSIDTMTPTVVSRPVPASAIAKRDSSTMPPPSRYATYTAAPINSAE